MIKRTGEIILKFQDKIKIRALDVLIKEEIAYHEKRILEEPKTPELQELQDQILNEESSFN